MEEKKITVKLLEFITKFLAWLQIVVSPLIVGIVIGIIVYANKTDSSGKVIAVSIASLGLILGIILATRIWRKKGTVEFISRVRSTPELDNKEEKEKE